MAAARRWPSGHTSPAGLPMTSQIFASSSGCRHPYRTHVYVCHLHARCPFSARPHASVLAEPHCMLHHLGGTREHWAQSEELRHDCPHGKHVDLRPICGGSQQHLPHAELHNVNRVIAAACKLEALRISVTCPSTHPGCVF